MHRIDSVVAQCADSHLQHNLIAACRAALTGGSILRTFFSQPHTISMKGATDLQTEADLASEAAILAALSEDSPGISILAEESSASAAFTFDDPIWVVDPLDGTTNFAHGFPHFAVSIALVDQGVPQIGVIYLPCSDELFCSWKGGGAWLNGENIQVTEAEFLIEALIGTGFPYDTHTHLQEIILQIETLLPKVRDLRRAGAAAVDLAYVACGRLDGFYERELKPWDTAAGWLLVEEAGGITSDYSGEPYNLGTQEIAAANPVLLKKLLPLLT
ncbi:MAG: inositol monophosphatase [Desulfobulbus propionicus]|nr:MAG: inositol monophosphatase [Desulfobulbus propionicus]PIE65553.1 MAG: inositol monophosphatase [Desulfobacterales bacterium]